MFGRTGRGKVQNEVERGSSMDYHQLDGAQRANNSEVIPRPKEAYANDAFAEDTKDEDRIRDERRRNKKQRKSKNKNEQGIRLHHIPKSAWGAIDDSDKSSDEPEVVGVLENNGPEVRSRSVEGGSLYIPGDTDDLEMLLDGVTTNRSITADCLERWKQMEKLVVAKATTAHEDLENRKLAILTAIEGHFRQLHQQLNGQVESLKVESSKAVERLEEAITGMNQVVESRSVLVNNPYHVNAIKVNLFKWKTEFDELRVPDEAQRVTFRTSGGNQSLVERLFDSIETGTDKDPGQSSPEVDSNLEPEVQVPAKRREFPKYPVGFQTMLWSSPKKPRDKEKLRNYPDTLRIQYKVHSSPLPVITFSCRLSKDRRTCGVTDLVVTDNGDVIVVDKHNKCLKMFDSKGSLRGLFANNYLRKPSRVSHFRSGDQQVAVTDDANNMVHLFTMDGQVVSRLSLLERPVSHCQLRDSGHVALLEFSDRSVVICEPDGELVKTFPTRMDCPAYMASTTSGRIVITDWKSGSMKIFNSSGKELFSQSRNGSSTSNNLSSSTDRTQKSLNIVHDLDLEEPYGVCCDDDGIVFVADRKRREVILFSEDGSEIWSYDDSTDGVGIPFAVACNGKGILAVGEYTGTVRIYRYKLDQELENSEA